MNANNYTFSLQSAFGQHQDCEFMHGAIMQARKAFELDEVPIGAVVVNKFGEIIGSAHNLVQKEKCQYAHAEVLAIQDACKKIGDWRLEDCWMYVTLEPCAMCIGLIQISRFAGVVFGAASTLFGFQLDNSSKHSVYKSNMPIVVQGVEATECLRLLQHFFKMQREKRNSNEN